MDPKALSPKLDDWLHELDMLVYRLEQDPSDEVGALLRERARTRRELERLRDDLAGLVRQL